MKLTVPGLAGAGMLLVMICLTGCQSNQTPPPTQSPAPPPPPPPKKFVEPSDTPINIGGDSIYGCFQNGWQKAPAHQPYNYMAKSSGNDTNQITTKNIAGIQPGPLNVNGWVIQLSNRDSQHPQKKYAVTISTDPSKECFDPMLTGCKLSIGDQQTVYIAVRSDSRWTEKNSKNLRYHDKKCDGASGTGENRQCDYLVDVTITSQGPQMSGQCTDGVCGIGIGADLGAPCDHNN